MNIRTIAAMTLAAAGAFGATAAQAQADIRWSVTIGLPNLPIYIQPAPVYRQWVPVYSQPAPVYREWVPVYSQPAPVYTQQAPVYGHHYATRRDRDGDGILDRHDHRRDHRRADRPWDRDRDGVPDRYERYPGNHWRH